MGAVIAWGIHRGTDLVGLQDRIGYRREHRLDVILAGESRVEPMLLERLRQDHRAAVVDVSERIGGRPGQNRCRSQPGVRVVPGQLTIAPQLVEARHREHPVPVQEVQDFLAVAFLPLEVAVRR